jgi:hypothetical protein
LDGFATGISDVGKTATGLALTGLLTGIPTGLKLTVLVVGILGEGPDTGESLLKLAAGLAEIGDTLVETGATVNQL